MRRCFRGVAAVTYRNRSLLDLAHEAPCFLQLGAPGCGEYKSVPAHSDMIRHGRGEKHKSHDCFAVSACPGCHALWTRANLGREGYHAAWVEAIERYLLYLWVSGLIQVTAAPKAGKEPSMEAPKCKICDHNHWAREPHILPAGAAAEKRSKRILSSGGIKADPAGVPDDYAGGSANAVIAAGAKFAPMGESPERTPGANRAQNGVTARRDGKPKAKPKKKARKWVKK